MKDTNTMQQSLSDHTPFVAHFDSPAAVRRLQLHDTVDYRYHNGLFILWTVIDRNDLVLKLHPAARDVADDKYDQTVLMDLLPAKYTRFAAPKSISHRKWTPNAHDQFPLNVAMGQMVDINPPRSGHRGWKSGRITKMDSNSSQIRVQYTLQSDDQVHSYWFHPENSNEVAPFETRSKSSIPSIRSIPSTPRLTSPNVRGLSTKKRSSMFLRRRSSRCGRTRTPQQISHRHSMFVQRSSTSSNLKVLKHRTFEKIEKSECSQIAKKRNGINGTNNLPISPSNASAASIASMSSVTMRSLSPTSYSCSDRKVEGLDTFGHHHRHRPSYSRNTNPKSPSFSVSPSGKPRARNPQGITGVVISGSEGEGQVVVAQQLQELGYDSSDIDMAMQYCSKTLDQCTGSIPYDLHTVKWVIDEMTMRSISFKIRSRNQEARACQVDSHHFCSLSAGSSVEWIDGPFDEDEDSEESDLNLAEGAPLSPNVAHDDTLNRGSTEHSEKSMTECSELSEDSDDAHPDHSAHPDTASEVVSAVKDTNRIMTPSESFPFPAVDSKNTAMKIVLRTADPRRFSQRQATPEMNSNHIPPYLRGVSNVLVKDSPKRCKEGDDVDKFTKSLEKVMDDDLSIELNECLLDSDDSVPQRVADIAMEEEKCEAVPFVACLTKKEMKNLQELDRVDHRNPFGQFCRAKIVGKNEGDNSVKLHYEGWSHQYVSMWDGWCTLNESNRHCFAPYGSISSLVPSDYVILISIGGFPRE